MRKDQAFTSAENSAGQSERCIKVPQFHSFGGYSNCFFEI